MAEALLAVEGAVFNYFLQDVLFDQGETTGLFEAIAPFLIVGKCSQVPGEEVGIHYGHFVARYVLGGNFVKLPTAAPQLLFIEDCVQVAQEKAYVPLPDAEFDVTDSQHGAPHDTEPGEMLRLGRLWGIVGNHEKHQVSVGGGVVGDLVVTIAIKCGHARNIRYGQPLPLVGPDIPGGPLSADTNRLAVTFGQYLHKGGLAGHGAPEKRQVEGIELLGLSLDFPAQPFVFLLHVGNLLFQPLACFVGFRAGYLCG